MTEPDVAITDYLIALETTIFAALIFRSEPGSDFRWPFVILFSATAAAALAGGTVHGFFSAQQSVAATALWRTTLLALGLAAYAAWTIGARLLLSEETARTVQIAAAGVAVCYAAIVVAVTDRFWVALVHYLPPVIFLLMAFAASAMREPRPSAISGVAGLVLTLAAAVVQLQRIAIHPVWFNHNATYHVIQAVGLLLIYKAARGLM